MLLVIKQWESKYLRDFSAVKDGVLTEEKLYTKLISMYYNFVSDNGIEPFTITYGRGNGFCINANSHIGVIVNEDIVLYITSMVPDLTLGKILYLQSLSENDVNNSMTKQVLAENLNDTEKISAVDYFVVSLVNVMEDIKQNGLLSELSTEKDTSKRIVGKLDLERQVTQYPAYEFFCVEKTGASTDIIINRIIKTAIVKAKELTTLEWIIPMLADAEDYLSNVIVLDNVEADDFPEVKDFTSIKREDYEKAIRFAKFILLGFDPFAGDDASFFPEFMLDMNIVFELYVTTGLKRIFKMGFDKKRLFSLGLGPVDVPMDRKNIELDGFYENDSKRVVLDTKNKYRNVIDREIPDFIAANPDIYQQYYYASRVNAKTIILVYPSSRKRTSPIGSYFLEFEGNKRVDLYFWGLDITGSPRENKKALINLAKFIEELPE